MSSEPITDVLLQASGGDPSAIDRLFPLVYDELRRIAHRALQRERASSALLVAMLVEGRFRSGPARRMG